MMQELQIDVGESRPADEAEPQSAASLVSVTPFGETQT
jgi:hypothetical protein